MAYNYIKGAFFSTLVIGTISYFYLFKNINKYQNPTIQNPTIRKISCEPNYCM